MKWLLAIPHYFVLFFLEIGAVVAVIVAWFAILFTGRYPRGLFDFVEGVMRWHNRVIAYAFVLVTDAYPPFRLSAVATSRRFVALDHNAAARMIAPTAVIAPWPMRTAAPAKNWGRNRPKPTA